MATGRIDTRGIRNIILDLGGVILDLDVQRTIHAFHDLGFPKLESADIILSEYPFFLDFEIGKISPEEFVNNIIGVSGDHVTREDVLKAWNSMILGFRSEVISRLMELRQKYRLFLLSNTNAIHEILYNEQLNRKHGIPNLDRIFEKVYYSHMLKMRKPDLEIFRYVLRDARLIPEQSLYIDDTSVHVDAAGSLGIRTYHLEFPEQITDVL